MEVRLPNLGEDTESGTVASVFVKPGDRVEQDQPLIELESEKAVASVPSPAPGRVAAVHVEEGQDIRTGTLIVTLEDDDAGDSGPEDAAPERERGGAQPRPAEDGAAPPTRPKLGPRATKPDSPPSPAKPSSLPDGVAPPASPSIRKIARDLGLDLGKVRGTARGGRIVLGDLRDYIARLEAGQGSRETRDAPPPRVDFARWGAVSSTAATSIRKTIAQRMSESWHRIPHVTQFGEADITDLDKRRREWADRYKEQGARLTLTPVILRALARTMERHPLLNSSLDESNWTIVRKDYCHFGLAVDTEAGLLVPVIRDVDAKSLLDIAREVESLGERARERKLTREELQGGSFTLSNQGGIGGTWFTPIINYPEAAILGVGRGRKVVSLTDGKPEARLMLPLAVSHDHRVVDGADGVRFLVDLVRGLEELPDSEFELG
jgi:pyruvate dehydrogenase E2 component (dihydrolipoamide acetyltransferase)